MRDLVRRSGKPETVAAPVVGRDELEGSMSSAALFAALAAVAAVILAAKVMAKSWLHELRQESPGDRRSVAPNHQSAPHQFEREK